MLHIELGDRLGQHQQDGQQHGKERGAQSRESCFIAGPDVGKGIGYHLEREPVAQQFEVQGAADKRGKEADRQTIDDDGTHIGAQLIGDIEGCRVGRYDAVHGHQGGAERNGQGQQRGSGLAGDGEGERDQQHYPHFDKEGDATYQTDQHHDDLWREPAAFLQGEADALRRP